MDDAHQQRVKIVTHFGNGRSVERWVHKTRALSLLDRRTAIIPPDADLLEIKSVNITVIVPAMIMFYVNKAFLPSAIQVTKDRIFHRDNGKCAYCGKLVERRDMTIDHIIPVSKGGRSEWKNVVLACQSCNTHKGSKSLSEARMKILVSPYAPKSVLTQ